MNINIKNENKLSKMPFHYSWIIMLITFLTLLISSGIRSTSGVLIVPLEEYFGWNRTVITFSLAINLVLYGLCGPFSAALIESYGIKRVMLFALSLLCGGTYLSSWMQAPWHMTVLWGVLVGTGAGLTSQVLGSVVANRWFSKHRGLIIGIFGASTATGQLVFLPLFAKLLENHTWRILVIITSITALVIGILVLIFMRNKPKDIALLPYGASEDLKENAVSKENPLKLVFDGLKTGVTSKDFWLLSGSFFVCGASTNGLIGTHFISACMDYGITEVHAAGMLSVIGIFDILGTTISGWLSDRFDNRWLLFWYYGLRGLSLLILPFVLGSSFLGIGVFIVFYGLDWVATVPPTARLCTDIFKKQGGIIFGWILTAHQIGAATATFAGGTLHTLMGNYNISFIAAGLICLIASLLVLRITSQKTSCYI